MEGIKSAADTTKQFVTLSTGVLAVTITFADKLGLGASRIPLFLAWSAFMAVIVMGTLTLMEITSEINRSERAARAQGGDAKPAPNPLAPKITKLAIPMVLAFWGGMGMVLLAGVIVIAFPVATKEAPAQESPAPKAQPLPAAQALPPA